MYCKLASHEQESVKQTVTTQRLVFEDKPKLKLACMAVQDFPAAHVRPLVFPRLREDVGRQEQPLQQLDLNANKGSKVMSGTMDVEGKGMSPKELSF